MKKNHGKYLSVYWGDDDPSYEAVHGHVGLEVFSEAMTQQGLPAPDSAACLEHVYFRFVPSRGVLDGLYIEVSKSPGAFPVTLWRF